MSSTCSHILKYTASQKNMSCPMDQGLADLELEGVVKFKIMQCYTGGGSRHDIQTRAEGGG